MPVGMIHYLEIRQCISDCKFYQQVIETFCIIFPVTIQINIQYHQISFVTGDSCSYWCVVSIIIAQIYEIIDSKTSHLILAHLEWGTILFERYVIRIYIEIYERWYIFIYRCPEKSTPGIYKIIGQMISEIDLVSNEKTVSISHMDCFHIIIWTSARQPMHRVPAIIYLECPGALVMFIGLVYLNEIYIITFPNNVS